MVHTPLTQNDASSLVVTVAMTLARVRKKHARVRRSHTITIIIVIIITISNHYNVLGGIRAIYLYVCRCYRSLPRLSLYWEGFVESVLLFWWCLSAVKPTRSHCHKMKIPMRVSLASVWQIKCSMYSYAGWSIDYTYVCAGVANENR